ncbi:MAG: hypothetical protein HYX67_04775 [Candidatus Melainabacteria bacterium]|nr:hypothetical protein [Candidatus Melainabacteria bacterium]
MMVTKDQELVKLTGPRSHLSIYTGPDTLPIEITVTGKLPPGAGGFLVDNALQNQAKHAEFVDEYNEPSALIGKTNFEKNDPTAVYTFGVDTRDLTFHKHAGHRAIIGITGSQGCLLKFSLCTEEEALRTPNKFIENLYIVDIPGDRLFALRFSGTVYHQFCPANNSENGFFAVSVHTNEAGGLTGDLLTTVLSNRGNIPLLTEPAPDEAMQLLVDSRAMEGGTYISLDIE